MSEQEFQEAIKYYPGKWQQAQQSTAELGYRLGSEAYQCKARALFVALGGKPLERCERRRLSINIPDGFIVYSAEVY